MHLSNFHLVGATVGQKGCRQMSHCRERTQEYTVDHGLMNRVKDGRNVCAVPIMSSDCESVLERIE
jgi:hypothetical protein